MGYELPVEYKNFPTGKARAQVIERPAVPKAKLEDRTRTLADQPCSRVDEGPLSEQPFDEGVQPTHPHLFFADAPALLNSLLTDRAGPKRLSKPAFAPPECGL